MALQAPDRSEAITVRLTREEKERLAQFALTEDLRLGQAARRIVNAALSADADGPRDGRAA